MKEAAELRVSLVPFDLFDPEKEDAAFCSGMVSEQDSSPLTVNSAMDSNGLNKGYKLYLYSFKLCHFSIDKTVHAWSKSPVCHKAIYGRCLGGHIYLLIDEIYILGLTVE